MNIMWKQLSGRRSVPSGSKKVKVKNTKKKKLRSTPGLKDFLSMHTINSPIEARLE